MSVYKCDKCESIHTVFRVKYSKHLVECVDCGAVYLDNKWISRAEFEHKLNNKEIEVVI